MYVLCNWEGIQAKRKTFFNIFELTQNYLYNYKLPVVYFNLPNYKLPVVYFNLPNLPLSQEILHLPYLFLLKYVYLANPI